MPIARTLGNCLSVNSISILVARLGPARTLDMVLRARSFDAEEAEDAGFVAEVCDDGAVDEAVARVTDKLLGHAPLTMWAAKVAVARIRRANLPGDDDLVTRVYGSDDFRRGVAAFGSASPGGRPSWTGK